MATQILGLLSSDKFQAAGDRFNSHRRAILHIYPSGGAPLTGVLSIIDSEPLTDSIYYWYEKRYVSPKTTTRGTNPLTSTAPSTGDANDGTVLSGAQTKTDTTYIKVASTKEFRQGQVVQVVGSTGKRLQFWVVGLVRGVTAEQTNGYLQVLPIQGYTFAAGDAHAVGTSGAGATVRVLGTSFGEGAGGGSVTSLGFKRPIKIENTTQIFRTPMEITGSALQMGLKYDATGPYKERAKDLVIEHMTSIERAILFGTRSTTIRTALDGSGRQEEVRTFSGIEQFLELWDAGATGLDIDGATYAPYSHKQASTSDDDDDKRVIENSSGEISVKKWNVWAERVARYSSAKTKDKLVVCGSGALLALAEMFRKNATFNVKEGETIYGLDFTTLVTPFGKFHFMTHPLFNEDPEYRNRCLILDPHTIKLRPLKGRDTKLLKNRQNNGDDFRKDEYLSELGLEMHKPECNMLIKNISTYVAD